MASRRRHTPLRTSKQDIRFTISAPQTPQTASSSHRLAYTDEGIHHRRPKPAASASSSNI